MKGSCQRSSTSYEAYAAGALQGRQRRMVEDHLNSCATCRAEVTLTQAVQEARTDAAAPLAEERAQRIFGGVQQTLESPAPAPRARRGWRLALAVSGAAALLVVALLLVNRQRTRPPQPSGRSIARSHGVRAWAAPGSVASFALRADGVEASPYSAARCWSPSSRTRRRAR